MRLLNWDYCQENSDQILMDGILKLKGSKISEAQEVSLMGFGNYLISHDNKPYYIGEAKDVKTRIKQQFKPTTSTFYKNFIKHLKNNQAIKPIPIEAFSIRCMPTVIGRKEVEDFGIVNIPTVLNKFQIGKRKKIDLVKQEDLWEQIQAQSKMLLNEGEEQAFQKAYLSWDKAKPYSTSGIYIVRNGNQIIYIGESSDVNERHITHSTTTYFSALRRHIATEILSFELKEIKGKKKYLTETENKKVTDFLRGCSAIFHGVTFGRYELEEYLIAKYNPLLNRKGNA